MRVAAVSLQNGVSLTLLSDDDQAGWRFVTWNRNAVPIVGLRPTAAEREREFFTVEDAVAYFLERYGERLAAGH